MTPTGPIEWARRPDGDDRGLQYQIWRTPTAGSDWIVCASHDVTGVYTHYAQRRTMPCGGDQCDYCAHDLPRRWHGYLWTWSPKIEKHSIFEFTAMAADAFDAEFRSGRTLRGLVFRSYRMPKRANGRVMIELNKQPRTKLQFPDPPKMTDMLYRLWGMTKADFGEAAADRQAARTFRIAEERDRGIDPNANGSSRRASV